MPQIKTDELEGVALDWAVAKALNIECEVKCNASGNLYIWRGNPVWSDFKPSTDWSHAGPLIEQYKPDIMALCDGKFAAFLFNDIDDEESVITGEGDTYLQALCRVIINWKLGPLVEIPDALVVN